MKLYITFFLSGVLAGILLAPEKGRVTREKLRNFLPGLAKEWEKDVHAIESKIEKAAEKIDGLQQPV